MPPSTARIVTSQPRTDHTHWKCKTCEAKQLKEVELCTCCGKGKADNALAMRDDDATLGEFHSKNELGEDVWSYYIKPIPKEVDCFDACGKCGKSHVTLRQVDLEAR